jgi:WD40 repeat protein
MRFLPAIGSCVPMLQKYLVCAVGSGFCIFDTSTGETLLEKNSVHDGKVLCVKPVFYDSLLATCSEDGLVKLWGNASILRGDASTADSLRTNPKQTSPEKTDHYRTGFLSNFGLR